MLSFLVHKTFTFYRNSVLKFKCPAPGPKSYTGYGWNLLYHFLCTAFSCEQFCVCTHGSPIPGNIYLGGKSHPFARTS